MQELTHLQERWQCLHHKDIATGLADVSKLASDCQWGAARKTIMELLKWALLGVLPLPTTVLSWLLHSCSASLCKLSQNHHSPPLLQSSTKDGWVMAINCKSKEYHNEMKCELLQILQNQEKKLGAPETTGIFLEPFYDSHRRETGLFAIIVSEIWREIIPLHRNPCDQFSMNAVE